MGPVIFGFAIFLFLVFFFGSAIRQHCENEGGFKKAFCIHEWKDHCETDGMNEKEKFEYILRNGQPAEPNGYVIWCKKCHKIDTVNPRG